MADQIPNKQAGNPVGQFGDPLLQITFTDPEKKKDKEFGRQILQRIFKEQNNQSTSFYFGGRNIRWKENWDWAMGRQNMNEFVDYVSTQGNKAYSPVDMTQNRIGPQFLGVLINSMSQNEEYISVRAIDDGSVSEKEQVRMDALFRMREVETISELQKMSGIQLEPTDAYVPDDELSAETYFKLEYRLPKEIEFELKLDKSSIDNKYKEKNRATKKDLIVLNCAATKIEKLDNGFIGIRKCNPANLIYNFFMSDSGQMELSYIGEVYHLKVKDLRRKYSKSESNPTGLTEKEMFEMARTANQFNNANRFVYNWNESYMYATDRPYDDYGIDVFDCELQTVDYDYYVSKQDNYGKEKIQPKKGIPKPESDKAKVVKKEKLTWYRGIWAVKSDKMIYWGLPDLTIRPYMNIAESLSSYSIQIPNNDGDYVPSLFERGLSPLRKWTLCDLKLKQLIANLRASGISIDTETIRDIDLGSGNTISALEVVKIYNQTGNVLWSSKGLDPNRQQDIPIKEMPNAGSIAQLGELVNVKNDSMQELRSVWGVPLYRDGSDLPPRMGAAVVENQTTNSNNVTDFINYADKALWEETFHKVCMLNWDDMVLKQGRKELMNSVFETEIDIKPTAYEKQMLEQNIQIGMKSIDTSTGKPLLSFKDAFKIRNIKNYKLAEMYLANTIDKNEKMTRKKQMQDQQANIESQQQSAQLAAEEAMKLQEDKLAAEKEMQEFISNNKKQEILLEKGIELYKVLLTPKTGEGGTAMPSQAPQIPPALDMLLNQTFENIALTLAQDNKKQQQQMVAEQQEEQMAMEEQQMMAEQQQGQQQPMMQ